MDSDNLLFYLDKFVAYSIFIVVLSVILNWSRGELDLTALKYEYVIIFSMLGSFGFVWSNYRRKKLERRIEDID